MTYQDFIVRYLQLMQEARSIKLGGYTPMVWPQLSFDAPIVVSVTAHPDDWPLTAGPIALRLRREGYDSFNVPATLGRPAQYQRRATELVEECNYFGTHLLVPNQYGLRDEIKGENGGKWEDAVAAIVKIFTDYNPKVVITHHYDEDGQGDGHHDHVATAKLVRDALLAIPEMSCYLVEGEFWKDMATPNLQLEVSTSDLASLSDGLSAHVGELERNRYDLFSLPHMNVNARYGELVTGWGTPAAEFPFSVMYRVRKWENGELVACVKPLQLAADQPVSPLFS